MNVNDTMNLNDFYKARDEGWVYEFGDKDIVGFVYSHDTIKERRWNFVTRAARGILFERAPGRIVALPFSKFFNLFERHETEPDNLPDCPFTIEEKVDGSLGILYFYNGQWNISTKGSLTSDQATYASTHFLSKYNFNDIDPNFTILTEIIYPENRIVVDYKDFEGLRLLSLRHKHTGKEQPAGRIPILAAKMGMLPRKTYDLKVDCFSKLPMPDGIEGYVVRFENDLRVKIKSPWYLKLHRALDRKSLKRILELVEGGEWRAFWNALPKEFQKDFDDLYAEIRTAIWDIERRAKDAWDAVAETGAHLHASKIRERRRHFAQMVQIKVEAELHPIMFAMLDMQDWRWLVFKILKGKLK